MRLKASHCQVDDDPTLNAGLIFRGWEWVRIPCPPSGSAHVYNEQPQAHCISYYPFVNNGLSHQTQLCIYTR